MKAKVTYKLAGIQRLLSLLQGDFGSQMGDVITSAVKDQITKGLSPVASVGRYVEYSDSYNHSILSGVYKAYGKRSRPVNLTLSGKMLGSMYATKTDTGIIVGISDPKAVYHDIEGAGKAKTIRRLLPTRKGETFSRPVLQAMMTKLKAIVTKRVSDLNGADYFQDTY